MDKKQFLLEILNDINVGEKSGSEVYANFQLFGDLLDIINDEGFAKGIDVRRGGQGNLVQFALMDKAKITLRGLDYLERHNIVPL